jgi:signal transduction histidine kinase
MQRHLLDQMSIKTALLLGFGLTLGLWGLTGYQFMQRMAEVQSQAADVSERYMHAQETFAMVRSQVLLGSVYVRDALLDPDSQEVERYREDVEASYGQIDQALQRYVPVLDSGAERERVARLRQELEAFLATAREVLDSDPARWRVEARRLLRRIVPRREAVFRVSEEVQALNRAAFVQEQNEIAEIYAAAQRRIWEGHGLALAMSFAIAFLATRHAGRLEQKLQRQRRQEAENALDLQRLSAKLVNVQEDERRVIARELHDEIGQALTATKLELAFAQRAIEARGGPDTLLREAQSMTDTALSTVRDLSQLLHPALLDDLGLAAALDWYIRGYGRRNSVRINLSCEGMDERLASEIETAAYRIVQEALTNVSRHAHATTCSVRLIQRQGTLAIDVEDDGRGFDPENLARSSPPHLGLIGVRERVTQLRGIMRVESAPGRGTRLIIELPASSAQAVREPVDVAPTSAQIQLDSPQVLHG